MNHLEILEMAISDVGYWRWWVADLPGLFQAEFGGVQLWTSPSGKDRPPAGVIALRFRDPTFVGFLAFEKADNDLPSDWPARLQEDAIEPFALTHDAMALASPDRFSELVAAAECVQRVVGGWRPTTESLGQKTFLAFRAGLVGLAVVSQEMEVLSHLGAMSKDDIRKAHSQWWEYWEEYWGRRDTDSPLPYDYFCEATIPVDRWKGCQPERPGG